MSDTDSDDKKSGGRTLSLKRGGSGTVRQAMGGRRTNTVVVETRKRKFTKPGEKPAGGAPLAGGLKPRSPATTPTTAAVAAKR